MIFFFKLCPYLCVPKLRAGGLRELGTGTHSLLVRGCLLRGSVYGLTSPQWLNGTFLIRYFGNRNGQITKLFPSYTKLGCISYSWTCIVYSHLPWQHLQRFQCLDCDKKQTRLLASGGVIFLLIYFDVIINKLVHSNIRLFVSVIADVWFLSAEDLAVILLFVIFVSSYKESLFYYPMREKS